MCKAKTIASKKHFSRQVINFFVGHLKVPWRPRTLGPLGGVLGTSHAGWIISTHDVLLDFCTHTGIYHYSTFNLSYICYRQTDMYICIIYVLLISSSHIFLLTYEKHSNVDLLFCLEHILHWIDQ